MGFSSPLIENEAMLGFYMLITPYLAPGDEISRSFISSKPVGDVGIMGGTSMRRLSGVPVV